jgi:hypothetical protein
MAIGIWVLGRIFIDHGDGTGSWEFKVGAVNEIQTWGLAATRVA